MSLMMVLSLWDISIESIDGVGRLGGASRASEDRFSKLLKVPTPPASARPPSRTLKSLRMHTVWLPMYSIGVPMARRGAGSITTNDPGQRSTSTSTFFHVQGVYGAPRDTVAGCCLRPTDDDERIRHVRRGDGYMLCARGITPYTPQSAPSSLEHALYGLRVAFNRNAKGGGGLLLEVVR